MPPAGASDDVVLGADVGVDVGDDVGVGVDVGVDVGDVGNDVASPSKSVISNTPFYISLQFN